MDSAQTRAVSSQTWVEPQSPETKATPGAPDEAGPDHSDFNVTIPRSSCGLGGYFVSCALCAGGDSALTVALWSNIGEGERLLGFLRENADYSFYCFCASIFVVFVLYLLDFFWPPHEKGERPQFLVIKGERGSHALMGRLLFGLAGLFFVAGCLLKAKDYPSAPMLLTIFLCPIFLGGAMFVMRPGQLPCQAEIARAMVGTRNSKESLFQAILHAEKNTVRFYRAALSALLLSGMATLVFWICWNILDDRNVSQDIEEDLQYLLWAAPLVVAISNFVFGLMVTFRLWAQQSYNATDANKNLLQAEGVAASRGSTLSLGDSTPLASMKVGQEGSPVKTKQDKIDDRKERRRLRREQNLKTLGWGMKIVGCLFILFIGLLYVAVQLTYADDAVAAMVVNLMCVYFVTFVLFTFVAFKRVVDAIGSELANMPAWKAMRSVLKMDIVRACFVFVATPFIPFVLALSAVNQCVRRCRGIPTGKKPTVTKSKEASGDRPATGDSNDSGRDKLQCPAPVEPLKESSAGALSSDGSPSTPGSGFSTTGGSATTQPIDDTPSAQKVGEKCDGIDPGRLVITLRVYQFFTVTAAWNWLGIFSRCYIICFVHVCYTVCPVLLNVLLAWMTVVLEDWPYFVIAASTFTIGVVAFLLPPVPGMTVYIFGGLVMSNPDTCPYGFWGGALINIGLCWALKLVACAVQQKCIGEQLGRSLWVRRTVGVHKVPIRCIELVLRQKGLSVGKVAILCGGPDWPTSVFAGILRLSLVQCELGTVPIIFFVAPCALTGSFYLRKGENDFWTKSATMMVFVSIVVNMLLWALALWAIQRESVKSAKVLEKPVLENVDLEWLDYRDAQIDKASAVTWQTLPTSVRLTYGSGVLVHILVNNALHWAYYSGYSFFGDFQVYQGISNMRWWNDGSNNGIFTIYSIIALGLYAVFCICPLHLSCWQRHHTRKGRDMKVQELKTEEASWKADWKKDADQKLKALAQATTEEDQDAEAGATRDDADTATKENPTPTGQDGDNLMIDLPHAVPTSPSIDAQACPGGGEGGGQPDSLEDARPGNLSPAPRPPTVP